MRTVLAESTSRAEISVLFIPCAINPRISRSRSVSSGKDCATAAGRDSVKKGIVERVNKHTDYKIVDVYYTEFAVQ